MTESRKPKKVVTTGQVLYTCACAIIFLGVLYTILSARGEIKDTVGYLQNMEMPVVALIIPTIWFMYITAGGIWRPYLSKDGIKSMGLLARIQYELNFVNTVVPFLNILSGLAYATARLKKFGVSEGRAAGMYSFRYLVTIMTKWMEIVLAIAALIFMHKTGDIPGWVLFLLYVISVVIITCLCNAVLAVLKRIKVPKKLLNSPKHGETARAFQEQLGEMHQTIDLAFSDKEALRVSLIYGTFYSFLEILPFWLVATAMGHPELLLQIIIASGAAIIVGILVPAPMGIGGFDGAMILFLSGMSGNVALVSAITITTRVLVLVGTTVTGIPFWIGGMKEIKE